MSHDPTSTKETLVLADALIGKQVGPYQVRGLLGKGGMGVVYRAYDAALDRDVALKILPPSLSGDREYAERFEREARLAAKLDHARIVPIYATGAGPHGAWIAMQLVRGRTLAEELRDGFRPTLAGAVKIARQVAEALGAAHKAGLVHRDIKPANLIGDVHGDVKVLDFGLARPTKSSGYTQDGTYLGTPEYSSPEQCQSNDIDGRSDLYSLGVVMYEMLGGKIPHVAETPLALFNKIVSEEPIPLCDLNPAVPPSLAAVVAKLLAKNRDARYTDAAELIADLDKIQLRDLPSSTRETRLVAAGPADKARVAAWTLAATLSALLVAAVIYSHPGLGQASATGDGGGSGTATRTPEARTGRVVFLDFKNMLANGDSGWMETGLPEMIASTLAQHDGLNPLERDEVLAAMRREFNARLTSGGSDDPAAASAQGVKLLHSLQADVLVRGSFVAQGDDLRLIVTVFGLRDGALEVLVNRHQETGSVRDVIHIADRAAAAIAAALLPANQGREAARALGKAPAPASLNHALDGEGAGKLAALARRRTAAKTGGTRGRGELRKAVDAGLERGRLELKAGQNANEAGEELNGAQQDAGDASTMPAPASAGAKDPAAPGDETPAGKGGGAKAKKDERQAAGGKEEKLADKERADAPAEPPSGAESGQTLIEQTETEEGDELADALEALKAWARDCREREHDLPVQELGEKGQATK